MSMRMKLHLRTNELLIFHLENVICHSRTKYRQRAFFDDCQKCIHRESSLSRQRFNAFYRINSVHANINSFVVLWLLHSMNYFDFVLAKMFSICSSVNGHALCAHNDTRNRYSLGPVCELIHWTFNLLNCERSPPRSSYPNLFTEVYGYHKIIIKLTLQQMTAIKQICCQCPVCVRATASAINYLSKRCKRKSMWILCISSVTETTRFLRVPMEFFFGQ